jgi:orotidine 5'-phosphate decarboxylase subfamily 2
MPGRNFWKLLKAKWDERKFVCVGLDGDVAKLPILHLGLSFSRELMLEAKDAYRRAGELDENGNLIELTQAHAMVLVDAQLAFNRRIVVATKDVAGAYKPNSAFYEALGDQGLWALNQTIEYIHEVAPDVPVILDYKRGDIENTNLGYVRAAALADAMTVSPYPGWKAMKPFLDQADKGIFVLGKTSNEGSGEFQDQEVVLGYHGDSGEVYRGPLYQLVATHVSSKDHWNYNGNCAVVAGATYPHELRKIREIVGDNMPILIPGIGKQGGDLEATVRSGANSHGQGMIINNSRGVIFASGGEDFADAARAAVLKMHDDINSVLFQLRLEEVADQLFEVAVKFGAFRLKLHDTQPDAPLSPIYLNLRTPDNPKPGPLKPELVEMITRLLYEILVQTMDLDFRYISGLPRAGDPLAAGLMENADYWGTVTLLHLEKEEGTGGRRIARLLEEPKVLGKVLLVDDLITQADSKIEAIDVLEGSSLQVTDLVVLVDREQGGTEWLAREKGARVIAAFTLSQLLDYYVDSGKIDQAMADEVKEYAAASRV